MNKINIIVILTKNLNNRTNYLNSSLLFLKNTIEKNNYICEISIIDNPDDKEINENIEIYNKRVNYEKGDNEEYNKLKETRKEKAPEVYAEYDERMDRLFVEEAVKMEQLQRLGLACCLPIRRTHPRR